MLFAINRYQAHYLNQRFDIAQKYTNIFTLGLSGALFIGLTKHRWLSFTSNVVTFIGRRTFGVYIIQVFPMQIIISLLQEGVIPAGEEMPAVMAMVYLLAIIAVGLLISAALIALHERIPILNRLLPA